MARPTRRADPYTYKQERHAESERESALDSLTPDGNEGAREGGWVRQTELRPERRQPRDGRASDGTGDAERGEPPIEFEALAFSQ